MRRLLAEAIGTGCLVFAGTGAIVVDHATGGAVTPLGIALAFGLVVMAMIEVFGDISGAHLNPAVTLGFACARRFPLRDVPGYILAQSAGAFVASALLLALFPGTSTLGATLPAGSATQSFVLEIVLSFLLMLVILSVSSGPKERGLAAGLAVGGTVALCAVFGGPISGASMNPARSLAPAVLSGSLQHLWIYLVAPPLGAALAVACARVTGVTGARVTHRAAPGLDGIAPHAPLRHDRP